MFEGERRGRAGGRGAGGAGGAREGATRLPADRPRGGAGPARLAGPGRVDHVEVVDVDTGEVVLFWDLPAVQARRLVRALREDLGRLEADAFLGRLAGRRAARWVTVSSHGHARRQRDSAGTGRTAGIRRRCPQPEAAREWLATMLLIRRFEERAGEMYAKAKIGGFLHLCDRRGGDDRRRRARAARRATT